MTSPFDVVRYEQHPDRVDAVVLDPAGTEHVGTGETPDEALAAAVEEDPA